VPQLCALARPLGMTACDFYARLVRRLLGAGDARGDDDEADDAAAAAAAPPPSRAAAAARSPPNAEAWRWLGAIRSPPLALETAARVARRARRAADANVDAGLEGAAAAAAAADGCGGAQLRALRFARRRAGEWLAQATAGGDASGAEAAEAAAAAAVDRLDGELLVLERRLILERAGLGAALLPRRRRDDASAAAAASVEDALGAQTRKLLVSSNRHLSTSRRW